jgi:hypothetical protein
MKKKVRQINKKVKLPEKTEIPKYERHKDRLSYFYDIFQIDMTYVKKYELNNMGKLIEDTLEVSFEVEVEINPKKLYEEKLKLERKEKNQFMEICKSKFYS